MGVTRIPCLAHPEDFQRKNNNDIWSHGHISVSTHNSGKLLLHALVNRPDGSYGWPDGDCLLTTDEAEDLAKQIQAWVDTRKYKEAVK